MTQLPAYLRIILIVLVSSIPSYQSQAQSNYEGIKAAFILKLSEKIKWQKPLKTYQIGIYANDKEIYNTFKRNKSSIEINGANCEIIFLRNLKEVDNLNILFADKSKAKDIENIANAIIGKEILLITEAFDDPKYIMLNLQFNEESNKMSFEVNKANIVLENLSYENDLLLLGGTEVDIRELYRDMRDQFKNEQEALKQQKEISKSQRAEIEKQKLLMKQQETEMQVLSNNIKSMETELFTMNSTKNDLSNNIQNKERSLNKQNDLLEKQLARITKQDLEINTQFKQMQARKKRLDSLSLAAKKQEKIISNQKENINDKESLIKTQRIFLWSIAVFTVTFLFLSGLLYKSNKAKNKTYRELEVAQDQLVQQEKMAALGILTAGVAHEIKNPLNFIASGTMLLKRYLGYEEGAKDELNISKTDMESIVQIMDNIDIGVNRTVEIVKSLGLMSRKDVGKKSLCSIHDIIDNSLTILSHEFKNRIEIIKKYSRRKNVIEGQETQLYQLFTNILSNSMQAIEDEGQISIETTVDYKNKENSVIITDTGSGISKDNLNKIFDPFFTTKEPGEGTGLGLSIVFNIVDEHKGTIKYDSDGESWTSVKLSFPQKS